MTSCLGAKSGGLSRPTLVSQQIDQQIKNENKKLQHFKLLLLGTGESGKSTFAKQMTLIHCTEFPKGFMESFISVLMDNALSGMLILLEFLEVLGHSFPNELRDDATLVLNASILTEEVARAITRIWKDPAVKNITNESGDDAQIPGGVFCANYYFTHAERFAKSDFMPKKEDILFARRKTTGVLETGFTVGTTNFTLVDVGGQRSERKKWLHCFGGVAAVLYLTAINEYDMYLEEDQQTNRLVESLKLWKSLTSSNYFKKTPFILFLNKSDIFQEKVRTSPLSNIFPEYGEFVAKNPKMKNDFEKGWKYIAQQYHAHFGAEYFYPHLTCTLDTDQCSKVFLSVQDTLLKSSIGNILV